MPVDLLKRLVTSSVAIYIILPVILIISSPLLLITSWFWVPISFMICLLNNKVRTFLTKLLITRVKRWFLGQKMIFHTPAYALLTNKGKY